MTKYRAREVLALTVDPFVPAGVDVYLADEVDELLALQQKQIARQGKIIKAAQLAVR